MSRRLSILIVAAALLTPAVASAQQTVIFVRHGERADGGAGMASPTGAPADPDLSDAGKARAEKLAMMLADASIAAIYVTEFKRTQQTAAPLAAKLHLAPGTIPGKDAAAFVSRAKADQPKGVVLIVGHSNTMPPIIKAFGGPDMTIADDDYNAIYVMSPATGALTVIRY